MAGRRLVTAHPDFMEAMLDLQCKYYQKYKKKLPQAKATKILAQIWKNRTNKDNDNFIWL